MKGYGDEETFNDIIWHPHDPGQPLPMYEDFEDDEEIEDNGNF